MPEGPRETRPDGAAVKAGDAPARAATADRWALKPPTPINNTLFVWGGGGGQGGWGEGKTPHSIGGGAPGRPAYAQPLSL